jgi:hypothetical protein
MDKLLCALTVWRYVIVAYFEAFQGAMKYNKCETLETETALAIFYTGKLLPPPADENG